MLPATLDPVMRMGHLGVTPLHVESESAHKEQPVSGHVFELDTRCEYVLEKQFYIFIFLIYFAWKSIIKSI